MPHFKAAHGLDEEGCDDHERGEDEFYDPELAVSTNPLIGNT